MKNMLVVTLIITLHMLAGCGDKNVSAGEDPIRRFSASIDQHFAMMTNANTEGLAFAEDLMQEILAISNLMQRCQVVDCWRRTALKFDYNSVPISHSDPSRGRCLVMMEDLYRNTFPRAAETEEARWLIRLEYLGWLRKMVMDVSAKRKYPKGVYVVKGTRLKAERGCRDSLVQYRDWLNNYNGYSLKYEKDLRWFESQFADRAKHMSPETKASLTAKIEKYLGRKMRTEKECDAEWQSNRRVTFPSYVPTTVGLEEKWEGEFTYF